MRNISDDEDDEGDEAVWEDLSYIPRCAHHRHCRHFRRAMSLSPHKKKYSRMYREHGRRQRQRQANINDAPEFLRLCRRQRNVDDVDNDTRVRMRTDDEELRKIETNNSTFTVLTIDYYAEDDWEELGSGHW